MFCVLLVTCIISRTVCSLLCLLRAVSRALYVLCSICNVQYLAHCLFCVTFLTCNISRTVLFRVLVVARSMSCTVCPVLYLLRVVPGALFCFVVYLLREVCRALFVLCCICYVQYLAHCIICVLLVTCSISRTVCFVFYLLRVVSRALQILYSICYVQYVAYCFVLCSNGLVKINAVLGNSVQKRVNSMQTRVNSMQRKKQIRHSDWSIIKETHRQPIKCEPWMSQQNLKI